MAQIKCAYCNKDFQAKTRRAIFCSDKCRVYSARFNTKLVVSESFTQKEPTFGGGTLKTTQTASQVVAKPVTVLIGRQRISITDLPELIRKQVEEALEEPEGQITLVPVTENVTEPDTSSDVTEAVTAVTELLRKIKKTAKPN